jgi:hypothetical protein
MVSMICVVSICVFKVILFWNKASVLEYSVIYCVLFVVNLMHIESVTCAMKNMLYLI